MARLLVILTTALAVLFSAQVAAAVGPAGAGELNAGLGCGAQCITTALVTPGLTGASIEVRSDVKATYTVKVSDQAPGAIDGVPWIPNPDASKQTWIPVREHTFTLTGLQPGTRYHVLVTATDAEDRTAHRLGTFETLDPPPLPPAVHHEAGLTAFVTFWKVKILNDADKGKSNKGEISFDYFVDGHRAFGNGMKKLKSGQSVTPHDRDWPVVVGGAPDVLELRVAGHECDHYIAFEGWKCPVEADEDVCRSSSDSDRACATVSVDLRAALTGALPGNFGTGMPGGHDAYVVFETPGDTYLRFLVYAYVDVVPAD